MPKVNFCIQSDAELNINSTVKRLLLGLIILLMTSYAYASDQWTVGTPSSSANVSDYPAQALTNNGVIDRLLSYYRAKQALLYKNASTVTVSAGEISCTNSSTGVHVWRQNASGTDVTFSDLDTGSEASSTTYYVYANCDANAATNTYKISINPTTPTGVTSYRLVGSFYNDASNNITPGSIATTAYAPVPSDSNGLPRISSVYDFGSSSSSYTIKDGGMKIAFGQISVGSQSSATISNLPFTSAASYVVFCQNNQSFDAGSYGSVVTNSSGSSAVVGNSVAATRTINWFAIGY